MIVKLALMPLRGGLSADLDSAAAARVPARRELAALKSVFLFSATA